MTPKVFSSPIMPFSCCCCCFFFFLGLEFLILNCVGQKQSNRKVLQQSWLQIFSLMDTLLWALERRNVHLNLTHCNTYIYNVMLLRAGWPIRMQMTMSDNRNTNTMKWSDPWDLVNRKSQWSVCKTYDFLHTDLINKSITAIISKTNVSTYC